MMKKVRSKLFRGMAAAILLYGMSLPAAHSGPDALGGFLIHATPFDHKLNDAGTLIYSFTPLPEPLRSSDELFFQARSIRYVADPPKNDYWQTPEETQQRWAGDCEDKAVWLFAQLKKNGHANVRLVIGKYRSIDTTYHVWVTMADGEDHVFILDPTVQKKIWRSSDFEEGYYRALYSFDGANRYRHDGSS